MSDSVSKQWKIVSNQEDLVAMEEMLNTKQIDINDTYEGQTAMIRAIEASDPAKMVKFLISKGADVNKPWVVEPGYEISPLFYAYNEKEVEAIELLVAAGAEYTTTEKWHILIAEGTPEEVQAYIDAGHEGFDINAEFKMGSALSNVLVQKKDSVYEMAKVLIQNGADVNLEDDYDRLPIVVAVKKHPEVIPLLTEAGVDLMKLSESNTLIGKFSKKPEHVQYFHYLIDAGLDINGINPITGSPEIINAIGKEKEGVAKELIKAGANLNVKGKYGYSTVSEACRIMPSLVKDLIEGGADPEYFIPDGWSSSNPIELAFEKGHMEVVELLKPYYESLGREYELTEKKNYSYSDSSC